MTDTIFGARLAPVPARHGWASRLRLAIAARRQRLALRDLDPRQLADIGISADQARAEAARPAWDVPRNWLN